MLDLPIFIDNMSLWWIDRFTVSKIDHLFDGLTSMNHSYCKSLPLTSMDEVRGKLLQLSVL